MHPHEKNGEVVEFLHNAVAHDARLGVSV